MLKYGEAVSWQTPGCSFAELVLGLKKANLDSGRAKELLPRNAFARAARKLQENRIIKKVKEEGNYLFFQFTREHTNATKDRIDYSYEAIVRLNKTTGDVICLEDPSLATQAGELLDAEMASRNSSDITRLIQRIFEDQSGDLIALRQQGGFYFVPTSQIGIVDQVENLVRHIGGTILRLSIAIDDSSASNDPTRQSIAESMVEHFNGLVEEFRDSCKNFSVDTDADVVGRRTEKLIKLRTKLISYTGILQDQAEGISDAIKRADQEMLARLSGDMPPENDPVSDLDRLLAKYINA